jgi:hypothetical protein
MALSIEKSAVVKIDADSITTRRLLNSTRYFDDACQQRPVRSMLERRWRDRRKVFMVTGIITLSEARVTLRQGKRIMTEPSLRLPGSVVVMAATHGAMASLGGLEAVLDSELAVVRDKASHAACTLMFPGENIMAVEYRQVDFSWFRKPSHKTPTLKEGAEWKAYLGSRGEESGDEEECESESEEEEEDDLVTLRARIGGSIELDDLGDFGKHEDYKLDNFGELWCIS